MIYDIFITPDAFEKIAKETGDADGLEALDQLLFPQRLDFHNVRVADPHAEHWWNDVQARAFRLPPQARDKALSLLSRISRLLLTSRTSDRRPPNSEEQWLRFLKRAENRYVDWIFTTSDKGCEGSPVVATEKLWDLDWIRERLEFQQSVGRSLADQEKLLRKMCQQMDWCVAELPYINGDDSGSEMITAKQLIRLASQSAVSDRIFHLDFLCKPLHGERVQGVAKFVRSLPLQPTRRVRVRFFWYERVLDRSFLAGSLHELTGGECQRRTRWLLSAPHVATGRDRDGEESLWTLGSRARIEAKQRNLNALFDIIGEPAVAHDFDIAN